MSKIYDPPKANKIQRLLWRAAGADKYLLEKSTYSDHVKYSCLGGIVLATGLMAALAGGYAFYIIFEPKGSAIGTIREVGQSVQETTDPITAVLAVLFGIAWGLIIFNIDRFIVASTGKGDGTEAITTSEFKTAVPRIIMGIIIAITISKPVEIRMFKTEIDVKLHQKQQEQEAEYKLLTEANYKPHIQQAKNEIQQLKQEIWNKEQTRDELAIRLQEEVAGNVGSLKEGFGDAARTIKINLTRAEAELSSLKSTNGQDITRLNNEILNWQNEMMNDLSQGKRTAAGLDGLLERIKIAHEIAGTWITLFITLLFMAIELTPIFFKMMLIKSPYDYLDDNLKDLIKAEQGIEIQYDIYKDKEGMEKNLVINHKANKVLKEKMKLLDSQRELSELVIEKWKQQEKKNIEVDPESYIVKG